MSKRHNDIQQRLKEWLDKGGYPLEMQVARTFRQKGFSVIQSDYFVDPESEKQREIDVVAFKEQRVDDTLLRISFVVECKVSKNKPWVLFTSDEVFLSESRKVSQRFTSLLGALFLRSLVHSQVDEDVAKSLLFALPKRPAYGVTNAFTEGKDVPYEACMSVAKAAKAKVWKTDQFMAQSKKRVVEIAFPVVVIDALLFEVFLEEDDIGLEKVDFGVLVWRNPVSFLPHTIIHIVTKNYLGRFVQSANETVNLLFSRKKAITNLKRYFVVKEEEGLSVYQINQESPF